jgi:hypothetical protein
MLVVGLLQRYSVGTPGRWGWAYLFERFSLHFGYLAGRSRWKVLDPGCLRVDESSSLVDEQRAVQRAFDMVRG